MTASSDPAGHGAGRVGSSTVVFDEGCPLCPTARRWLSRQAQFVPLVFVPATRSLAPLEPSLSDYGDHCDDRCR